MMPSTRRNPRIGAVTVLIISAVTVVLCLTAAPEWAWLGFVVAALAWWAVGRSAPRPTRRAPVDQRAYRTLVDPDPGEYVIDPDRSVTSFTVRKVGVLPVHGQFARVAGAVTITADPLKASVVAVVPTAEVDTGHPQRDRHLTARRFLDSERHPFMRFSSTMVEAAPANQQWVMTGDLTVRGVTQRLQVTATAQQSVDEPDRLRFTGRATLRRSTFGVTALPWLAGDHIDVSLEIEVRRR